jgi:prepilin peptidase CpaA
MSIVTIIVLIAAALIAGYTDWRTRRIPNWLTVAVVVYGIGFHAERAGWNGFRFSVGGLALGAGLILLPMLIPFAKRGLGAGDVKFLAAVGSIVGAQGVLMVFALATALGAIIGTFVLNRRNDECRMMNDELKTDSTVHRSSFIVHRSEPVSIPYGIALSVGTLLFIGGLFVIGH